ncbi:protein translocase subunit SecDF [Mesomycoplasma molare]|uniref:Protein translocase subunit SecF n=1 Tax=Mesomycoplasma molare TaxID=171288 RepID=A0ABY5TUL8_9BACT|nr:protein translocase subunit SecDF [Mesomycoplasma molare]UWD34348.1 protein translocase subunit SecDF [Mesomycoplasma molare]
MKSFFKKIFSPKNWKRWFIAFFTFSSVISIITLGSNFYVSKNINKSIEYGGGAEVLVQVTTDENEVSSEIIKRADQSIFNRLTGGSGLNGTQVSIEGDARIRISKSGISTNEEIQAFTNEVISKQHVIITDINNKPLFFNEKFVSDLTLDFNDLDSWKENDYIAPFAPGGAKDEIDSNNRNLVSIKLKNKEAQLEWTKATEYISKKPAGQNLILVWLNLKDLINFAKSNYDIEWTHSNYNPYNFVYVNEDPNPKTVMDQNNQATIIQPVLKESQFNAKNYLISSAQVNEPLSGESFVIQGNFTSSAAKQLALNINYGTDNYSLKLLSSSFVPKDLGENAFNSAIIAGLVSVFIISIFMIVNYGLLGVISTISLSLYIFLTLLLFTTVRGEYSPSTIAALIIGIGMSVDANIISFELIKKEVYLGANVLKANSKSNKFSFSTILDSNVTTLLVAVILFFFGTKDIKGFAITLIFSVIFTLFVMLFFTKWITTLLIKTGVFENNKLLLGVRKKYISLYSRGYTPKIERPNYLLYNKFIHYIPIVIFVIGIIVFTTFSIINKDISKGMDLSLEFSGGTNILIETNNNDFDLLNLEKSKNIQLFLENKGIINNSGQITIQKIDQEKDIYNLVVRTNQNITELLSTINTELSNNFSNINIITYSISSEEAESLVSNAIVSVLIALLIVILYIIFRMKWTFAISAIISLLHNVIIVFLIFVIFRLEISPIFIAAILSIIGYSVNDTIVVFDRIKEIYKELAHKEVNDYERLKYIVNKTIKETIKRSIYTSLTTILTILILIIFRDSTDLYFNIALAVGVLFGTYSSLFIATNIWLLIETKRNKFKAQRIKKNYWNTEKIKEQTFAGINDFEV